MKEFIAKHQSKILGVLSGFDRMLFRGTLLNLVHSAGMSLFMSVAGVLRKDFKEYSLRVTRSIVEASLQNATKLERPIETVYRADEDKESIARNVAMKDGIETGLVCVLKAVERCTSPKVVHVGGEKGFEIRMVPRKCQHLYHYMMDPEFGFMHARLQTWFPFNLQIYINGREWLARTMDKRGFEYVRADNCFTWVDDFARVQELADKQVKARWLTQLNRIGKLVNPGLNGVLGRFRTEYFWSLMQSEWATDLCFEKAGDLLSLKNHLMNHAITSFSSGDVMRFLGRKVHGSFQNQIVSDFKGRPEGTRVKHIVGHNSLKMYDKQGSVLRVETTINQTKDFSVFRRKEGDPDGEKSWRILRQGIADIRPRSKISQAANERYLDALSHADTDIPIGKLVGLVTKPVMWKKTRVRAFKAWDPEDIALLSAASRSEFMIGGFRNRDLQKILLAGDQKDPASVKQLSSRITRQIRLLRAHGLVRKSPRGNRYRITRKGIELNSALSVVSSTTVNKLRNIAA